MSDEPSGEDATALARTVKPDEPASAAPSLPRGGPAVDAPPAVGDVLGGRYELVAELGRGGEGVVYRARDRTADVDVALKLLSHVGRSEEALARFRRELRLARKVTDPRVVRIHDLVELRGRLALSMELVVGEPLSARLARGRIDDPRELLRLAHDLCRALAAAHEVGVTHRDLKPANVMIRAEGGALVTDFGVSRLHGVADPGGLGLPRPPSWPMGLTQEGALIGTPAYMAPEQLVGETEIGPTADVYALGLVLFQAATGRLPEDDLAMPQLALRRLRERPPPLATLRPDLDAALPRGPDGTSFCSFVDRCLSPAREDRWADGHAALVALTEIAPSLRSELPTSGLRADSSGAGRTVIDPHADTVLAPAARTAGAPPRRALWVGAVLAAGASVGALVLLPGRLRRAPPPVASSAATPTSSAPTRARFALEDPHRITFAPGCEEFPVFSPDDGHVVFDGTFGADSQIVALEIATGKQRKLTDLPGWSFAADVSPDGKTVAFLRYWEGGQGTWLVPFDGSAPPRALSAGSGRPSFRVDGTGLWAGTPAARVLYGLDGVARRTLPTPVGFSPRVSLELPDGRVVVGFPAAGDGRAGVAVYDAAGGHRLIYDGLVDETLALHPDGAHVLVTREFATGAAELVAVPLAGGAAEPVPSQGVQPRKGLRFSHDKRRVVWSTCAARTLLAQLVTDAAGSRIVDVEPNVEWDDRHVACAPGRADRAVLSTRAGGHSPWLLTKGAPPRRLSTTIVEGTLDLALSPVDDTVVFASAKGLLVARGGVTAPLTTDASDASPAFSRDGARVLFTRRDGDGHLRVLSIAATGGAVREEIAAEARAPAVSPRDGALAFLAGKDADALVPTLVDPKGARRPLGVEAGHYASLAFSGDGTRLALTARMEVIELDVATGKVVARHAAGSDLVESACYTTDSLVLTHAGWTGDLWLAGFGGP